MLQGDRRDGAARRSAACRTPRRSRSTAPTSPTCAAAWRSSDLSAVVRATRAFRVFREIVADGGVVRGFVVPGGAKYSRSELDELVEQAKQLGAAGLVWARPRRAAVQSSVEGARRRRRSRRRSSASGAGPADLLLLAAGPAGRDVEAARRSCACTLAKKENLLDPAQFEFLWVVDFPLFDWHRGREALGVRCTTRSPSPLDERRRTCSRPTRAASARKAYDLVLNGSEIGGGSIRIHDAATAARGSSSCSASRDEEAKLRFGFFLDALEYGTPPHGGIALGLDRIVAILARRAVDPRRDRVPEDRAGGRPDGRRALDGRRRSSCASCTSAGSRPEQAAVSLQ